MGKIWLLLFEKGRLLASELATMPATALPEGCEPPRISCMKKENVGLAPPAMAAPPVSGGALVLGRSGTGATTGAASSGIGVGAAATVVAPPDGAVSGGASKLGRSGTGAITGAGSSGIGATAALVAGAAAEGVSTAGISISGGRNGSGCCGTSMRIRVEEAKVAASSSKERRKSLGILIS